MSSEQDKDLVAKKNACCMQSTAPLAQYAQRRSLSPKRPFGNLLIPESVE